MIHLRLTSGFKKLLTLIALCLLLCANAIAQDKGCTDLKKVNNLDELLYQFYINLDSDCLFTMPLSELEEVWGFKILTRENLQPGQKVFDVRYGSGFAGKSYSSEVDAFFVEFNPKVNSRPKEFEIIITEAYFNRHGTLFPEGNYPKLLPEPKLKLLGLLRPTSYSYGAFPPLKNVGEYFRRSHYYWLNPEQTRMIIFSSTTGYVTNISVYDEIPEGYLRFINN